MARQPFSSDQTTFVKGLITEANPMSYPENASLEEVNFVLNSDGSRQRRLGMDYEDDYKLTDTGVNIENSGIALSSLLWENASGYGTFDIAVIQIGSELSFFNASAPSISAVPVNKHGGSSPVKVDIGGDRTKKAYGGFLNGKFVVVNGSKDVNILEYDEDTDTVTLTQKRLEVRDLFGVDDGLKTNERPLELSQEHKYNLRNQGWEEAIPCTNKEASTSSSMDPVEYTNESISKYPSNADSMWAAKVASAKEIVAINNYSPWELEKVDFGTSRAPMGRFIIDIFDRGKSRNEQGVAIVETDASSGGVVDVAAFAGRLFYAVEETSKVDGDNNSPNLGSMIFFSQVKDNKTAMTKCYAEADPTSEHIFDAVDTDGGYISIPEAGGIKRLFNVGSSLYVFCKNGVWEIHGGEEAFSATNQQVSKTSSLGIASPDSIVSNGTDVLYWSTSGIYSITKNDLTLRGNSNDLTYSTIQTYFNNIDQRSRDICTGAYDSLDRTYRWLIRTRSMPTDFMYNTEIVYSELLQAFYIFETDSPSLGFPNVCGYIQCSDVVGFPDMKSVVVENDGVKVWSDDVVVPYFVVEAQKLSTLKYFTLVTTGATHSITVSCFKDYTFRDWKTFDGVGVDAKAHMLTGYISGGSVSVAKELTYFTPYMKRTEQSFIDDNGDPSLINESSCIVQFQWDWVNSATQGRWTQPIEAYRLPRMYFPKVGADIFDYGFTTINTRNRIRGRGKVVSILFKTSPYKNLILLGWNLLGTASGT